MNFRKVFTFAILLPLPLLLIVGNKRKTWQALGSFVFLYHWNFWVIMADC